MTIAVSYGFAIQSLDISAAFLLLMQDVFLNVCNDSKLWKLKRCIYGLNDAPRAWYERVKKEFAILGAVMSVYDPALFFWYNGDELKGILTSHVDDFAYCGTTDFLESVVDKVKETFKISSQEQGSFKYLGLNVIQSEHCISIDQEKYIDSLQPVTINKHRKNDILMEDELTQLHAISGQLDNQSDKT